MYHQSLNQLFILYVLNDLFIGFDPLMCFLNCFTLQKVYIVHDRRNSSQRIEILGVITVLVGSFYDIQ